jgi:hypothetical protein
MEIKKLTKIFIAATIAVIAAFDVYVWTAGGTEATISWTMFEWSHEYPVFAFAMGFVMGHLFWQMKGYGKIRASIKKREGVK